MSKYRPTLTQLEEYIEKAWQNVKRDYYDCKILHTESETVASMYHALRPHLERFKRTRLALEYNPIYFDREGGWSSYEMIGETIKVDLAVLVFDAVPDYEYRLWKQNHKCLVAMEFKLGDICNPTPSWNESIKNDIWKLQQLKKTFKVKRGYFCFIAEDEPEEFGNAIAALRGKWYKNYYGEAQGFHNHKTQWDVIYP